MSKIRAYNFQFSIDSGSVSLAIIAIGCNFMVNNYDKSIRSTVRARIGSSTCLCPDCFIGPVAVFITGVYWHIRRKCRVNTGCIFTSQVIRTSMIKCYSVCYCIICSCQAPACSGYYEPCCHVAVFLCTFNIALQVIENKISCKPCNP